MVNETQAHKHLDVLTHWCRICEWGILTVIATSECILSPTPDDAEENF